MAVHAQPATSGVVTALTLPSSSNPASKSLRLLAILRVVTPVAQASTIALTVYALGVQLPFGPVAALLAIQAVIAALTWRRLRNPRAVSAFELLLQVHVDIAALAAMLYLTGGTENPFAPLFVLPVAIAASSLAPLRVGMTVLTTVCIYAALRYFHVPLQHPNGELAIYDLHEDGMVINYVFTAALLAFFVTRIRLDFERHARMLAHVRETQMRNDSMVSIGALAADCAHELSSPLGTMAVVVTELQRERAGDVGLQDTLQLFARQIQVAKQVVSNLTAAAGQRRAEAAGVGRLDQFFRQIVERARALHPAAMIRALIGNGEAGPRIVAEETLRQAFANLIDNAVRVSPCDVEVAADWSSDDLVVTVRDRGPGFPQDILGRLGVATKANVGFDGAPGRGLLLTNVTLGRLGGSLSLANMSEGGACAEVRLPLRAILLGETPWRRQQPR